MPEDQLWETDRPDDAAGGLPTEGRLLATPSTTRVVKTVGPHQAGSQRWHRRFGDQLVCVRYRQDTAGQRRFVTVELLVEDRPLRQRVKPPARRTSTQAEPMVSAAVAAEVQVYIGAGESRLRQAAYAAGARCDPFRPLWRMPLATAQALGLMQRIVVHDRVGEPIGRAVLPRA